MRTHVRFDNDVTFELTERAATAFAGYSTPRGWSFRATFGALVDGSLSRDATPHDISPGLVGGVGVSRQWMLGDGRWFITGSAGLSVAAASTHLAGAANDPRFVAGDIRAGAIAGRTLAKIWNPYVLARGFGGPVWWTVDDMATTGTDTRHFQLGAGLSVAMSFGLTLTADVSALGEQAASLGASWRL
ncbi:MAG: hypothetical protein HOV81_26550 [Kofleriaceae bacterium]|nr:hypothetical protein [Kofleriaceae bacterium]